jgi:hypothetical protein
MNKLIVSIMTVLLIGIVGASATTTYYVGDTVNFQTSIIPQCGDGHCYNLPGSEGAGCDADCSLATTQQQCVNSPYNAGCKWTAGQGYCAGIDPGLGCDTFTTKESCNAQVEGCWWVDVGQCLPDEQTCKTVGVEDCYWGTGTLSCDTDMSDGKGLYLYGGYALKAPNGTIMAQANPTLQCVNPYVASTSFKVDKSGVWKFCSSMYALEVSYTNQQCTSNVKDCDISACQSITVIECQPDASGVQTDFLSWLNGW